MNTKICTRCKQDLPFSEFYKGNDIFRLDYKCKKCRNKYYNEHRDKLLINSKKYYEQNKEQLLKQSKKYHIKYDKIHKIQIAKTKEKYYIKNSEKFSKYRKIHKQDILEYHKKYYRKNKIEILKKMLIYTNLRRKTNIIFRLTGNLRARMVKVLRGKSKTETTMKLVGCSIEKLKQHLESKFNPMMNWSNYGWHVDHIRPCASFDLSKPSQQRKCFHYTNLQPLWAKENLSKNCKISVVNRGD